MKELLQNKKVVAVLGIVIVVVLVAILGFALMKFSGQTQNQTTANVQPTEVPVLTLLPDAIGLTLTEDSAGQNAIIKVTKTDGLAAISFELDYTGKPSTGTEAVPRGAVGDLDLTKSPVMKKIPFGTCSDVCHYDTDISDVKVVLKVTKSDGKVYQVTQSLQTTP
jgi:hypothetical protein